MRKLLIWSMKTFCKLKRVFRKGVDKQKDKRIIFTCFVIITKKTSPSWLFYYYLTIAIMIPVVS